MSQNNQTSQSLAMAQKFLGQHVTVEVDRPLGSKHPKHGFVYDVNYGFIPGTMAPDGEELDAYVLGVEDAVTSYDGICIALIHRLNDDDDKLVVVPENRLDMTDDQIQQSTHFQEQFFDSVIIRK